MQELELSVVIPTFNEIKNVNVVILNLSDALEGVVWEVIFVDDASPDGTTSLVRQKACNDYRVRCIQRIGRRGLSTACIEGILASSAPYIAVMDGDLQHDEWILHQMLQMIRENDIDLVIGSRYITGGGTSNWHDKRVTASKLATWLTRRVLRVNISDPMSGFFMIRRQAFEECVHNLSGIGYKILIDLVASSPKPLRIVEIPFVFKARERGESKLDHVIVWEWALLL